LLADERPSSTRVFSYGVTIVEPRLHQWYTTDEAIAAFGTDGARESFCDGQFIVLPKVIMCLGTLGETRHESCVPSPSNFAWRPSRLDYEPSGEWPWLPEKVREVWDRTGPSVQKLRDHHIFLRTPVDEQFFYAGPAHLGSYGGGYDGAGVSASFSLSKRLPRDIWLKFGGYPGWLVDVNHKSHRVAAGEVAAFKQLVDELPGQEYSHLTMTRYEEDSLTVHTNARRGWLMYLRDPADGGVYTRDLDDGGGPDAEEVFRCVCGIQLDFPTRQTLPRLLAMQATVEFFESGELPRCVDWAKVESAPEWGDIWRRRTL
jgi:hypothetical protein